MYTQQLIDLYGEEKLLEEELSVNLNLLIAPIQKKLELFRQIVKPEYILEYENELEALKARQKCISNRLQEIYLEKEKIINFSNN
jgi:hypothetical protein